MKKSFVITLIVGVLISFPVFADFQDDFGTSSSDVALYVDTSLYGGDAGKIKKAILLAFLNRGWIMDSVEADRYVGSYGLDSDPMKAQFVVKGTKVMITTVKGAPEPRMAWLGNLRKDFLVFLVQQLEYK